MSSYSGGRRRAVSRQTAEEQVLDRISRDVSNQLLLIIIRYDCQIMGIGYACRFMFSRNVFWSVWIFLANVLWKILTFTETGVDT